VSELTKAIALLRQGELVGMPTETVYGLAADARNEIAVGKIFALKGRPSNHPLIVHLADAEQMRAWAANIPDHAWELAAQFWPGPMTMILNKLPGVLDVITGGQDSIGLRVPAHPVALALLKGFEDGLAAPSANRFGRISPTTAQHVHDEFGASLSLVLDGGPCAVGIESTIVDARSAELRILRPGSISAGAISAAGYPVTQGQNAHSPRVSGALESHYAPRTPAVLCARSKLESALAGDALLAIGHLPVRSVDDGIALSTKPELFATALYSSLRALDLRGAKRILIEAPPTDSQWDAINDRLRRACADSFLSTARSAT
jgi:L-threonylcarbamoyladenylate synthase